MAKTVVIILLSLSFFVQNTCPLGAAGRSIALRSAQVDCPAHCCAVPDSGAADNGIASPGDFVKKPSGNVAGYFVFRAQLPFAMALVCVISDDLSIADDLYKPVFLWPPPKPPSAVFLFIRSV